ncbi:MAG: glycosyltransferase [candidate division Zixibacteria bacterium]|nr:glycosyltransferase [candidate division Zixibacteria bacterium]
MTDAFKRAGKLCIITNRYPANPEDTASPFVRDFQTGLENAGIETVVFTPAYHSEYLQLPENVHRFGWAGGDKTVGEINLKSPTGLYRLYSFLREGKEQLFDLIERERPTHCLALWALPSGWFAYQVKKEYGIPYSVWCLGSDIYVWAKKLFFKQLTRTVLEGADYLFADGWDLADRTFEFSRKSCFFLPSQRKLPQAGYGHNPVNYRFRNFLYVGRWEKSKGVFDLVTAFKSVLNENRNVRLHLIGWGSEEKSLAEMIKWQKLEEFIKLVGKVDRITLSSYLKNCNWVVIPSQGDSIPLVFSEALQFRKPVIVTEVGDLGRLTSEYNLGKAVPPGRPDKLARAMLDVTRERKNYTRRMGHVLNFLSVERAVARFTEIAGHKLAIHAPAEYPWSKNSVYEA